MERPHRVVLHPDLLPVAAIDFVGPDVDGLQRDIMALVLEPQRQQP